MSKSWLFITVGLCWAFRSLQSFSDPNFYDPHNLNDWVALLTFSFAWWLLARRCYCSPPSRRPLAGTTCLGTDLVPKDSKPAQ